VHGDITVVGSWRPATRCAGDFWGVYPLGDGRVLIAIGDVTGHGVASAMVTAAALGACDVCARRVRVPGPTRDRARDPAVELGELIAALDTVVRRVGGGELAMTCFATILDAGSRTAFYVSCGHTAPYVCRIASDPETSDGKRGATIDLQALVGRGNPLGAGVPSTPRVHERTLAAGDVVVWYTDGVIEAQDPAGKAYGDRRLQQLLRRLDRQRLTPGAVHDLIQGGVAAHRAGRLPADDETVVVAQLGHSRDAREVGA
jgi:serine phosphatase RsbU (regulator of sigma subunit)